MHRISRAPVLSATRSRDSCWITSVSYGLVGSPVARCLTELVALLRPLENFDYPPALGRRQRPGLHQQHAVADAAFLLVMRLELARAPQHLAVEGVLDPVLHHDHDRLLHLVADDDALADLAPP